MNSVNLVLEDWLNQISNYDKLKISEAQELYKKVLSTCDEKTKKLYIDKIILGTLYVVYNYITRNNLSILSSGAYDINDIISSFIEIWIKKIYGGELLSVDKFSSLFTRSYFNEVYQNLVGKDVIVHETFGMPTELFAELFNKFIRLKNNGVNFTYNDLIKSISKDEYNYYYLIDKYESSIMIMFENIYNHLNFNHDENLEIGVTKINDFFKILIDMGITESISNDLLDDSDLETNIANKILFESFIQDIDLSLSTDRQRQVIHMRYGLDDGIPKSLEEVAKVQNVTRERVRQIEAKCLRLLRHPNRNMKRYI